MENKKYFSEETFNKAKEKVFSGERPILKHEQDTEQEKRRREISRYIERHIIELNNPAGEKDEKEIQSAFKNAPAAEKATEIYTDMISYLLEKSQITGEQLPVDPYLISEIKILWQDEKARQTFLKKYSEARVDLKNFHLSNLNKTWRNTENEIEKLEKKYTKLKQDLNLKKITRPTEVKAAKSKIINTKKTLERLYSERKDVVELNKYERVPENTDAASMIMYELLNKYRKEAKKGFVWLPSRKEIHQKILDTVEHTGKSPLLIGPPGTGKTTQIDAAALESTDVKALRIPCHSGLSEEGLISNRDIRRGEGARDYEGTIAEGFTGHKHSQDVGPTFHTGRWVNLDEISQLSIEKTMGPIKDVRTAKEGEPLSRYVPHKVLPGSLLTATSNLPIADERLEREFSRIPTDYFEMTQDNPELYEFMLAKLLRDDGSLSVIDASVLSPAYEKKEFPEDQRKILKDKSIVVAQDELIKDPSGKRHGLLYRLSYAVRAIQDSYIHGSKFNEKHLANTAFYEDRDDKGNLIIKDYILDLKSGSQTPIGGEMLTLKSGSSTFTPEIISKWLDGFSTSGKKDLTRWIRQMLENHINQTSLEDGERIRAIANYFHLFEETAVDLRDAKPLTPKEIGYLSPRVPRPVYVEKPITTPPSADQDQSKKPKELKEQKTEQVLLEDDARVLIKEKEISIDGELVKLGEKIRIKGEDFSFAGIIEDASSPHNGKPVGKLASGEELYSIFNVEELNLGILTFFKEAIAGETGIDNFKEDLIALNYETPQTCQNLLY